MLAGTEASMDGQTLFHGSSRAGDCGGLDWRPFAPPGGGAIWRRREHCDCLGTALARDRQRCAGADGRAQAEGYFGRVPRLVTGARQGKGLHLAWACSRTRRARPQGRLSGGLELRPRREAELQKKPWWPANVIAPTSRIGGGKGAKIKNTPSP